MKELELMTAIINSNPGISIEDAWKTYHELITRVHGLNSQLKVGETEAIEEYDTKIQEKEAGKQEKNTITKGYTRRSLKVKPQVAIQKGHIACCICGKEMNSINTRHLASHNGLDKEGYLKLCGYPEDQVLMSLDHHEKMQTQVRKAQKAREMKRSGQSNTVKAPRKAKTDS